MSDARWLVLSIPAPSADHAALLAEGLFAAGATAVEERPDLVITYLQPGDQDAELFVRSLADSLSSFNDGVSPPIMWEWLPDRDWAEAWKRGLGPRRVGERLIVRPSWTDANARADDIVITIDPQMAFGTGEHASTRGALRLLEAYMPAGARVLDIGTGSAVLAIAAALLGAHAVIGVEADADSLINARENLERNAVEQRIELIERLADGDYIKSLADPPFDLILANILSGVIIPLLPALRAALAENGKLVVAGILQIEAAAFSAAAKSQGFVIAREDREEEWWSAVLE
ncbi:MAG: 50S ribosomal protein L11 methyltransferase [Gemmatimonadota bacterium]